MPVDPPYILIPPLTDAQREEIDNLRLSPGAIIPLDDFLIEHRPWTPQWEPLERMRRAD